MSKKQQGYIRGEFKKSSFFDRHKVAINVFAWLTVAGAIATPSIRREIADYHLMQVKVAETLALVEAIAYDHGIQEVVA